MTGSLSEAVAGLSPTGSAWWPSGWEQPSATVGVTFAAIGLVAALAMSWGQPARLRWLGISMKAAAVALLLLMLLEPVRIDRVAEPQANRVVVLVDDSRSVGEDDRSVRRTLRAVLPESTEWRRTLSESFDVRAYRFDDRLQPLPPSGELELDGVGSDAGAAIGEVLRRSTDRPVAAIVLLSDGRFTAPIESADGWPSIYPVAIGPEVDEPPVRIGDVSVRESNFETAPVRVNIMVTTAASDGQEDDIEVEIGIRSGDSVVARRSLRLPPGQTQPVPLELKPDGAGVHFYTPVVFAAGDRDIPLDVGKPFVVDRAGGQSRVLYVCGRPNWEFKFLRRAAAEADSLDLVGLVRMARQEPKFTFRSDADRANPLFRGTGVDADAAAEYDEPVLIRLGTRDAAELRGGFPKTAEELFPYHAIILDDLEADFFTARQQQLVQDFVQRRGGSLMMLAGGESLDRGGYARTPIGQMLPVYVDRSVPAPASKYRLRLTREGWLEPWTRLRVDRAEERRRLADQPPASIVHPIDAIKPGARVLSEAVDSRGRPYPALVTQSFARGRVAASLVGDLWKGHLSRRDSDSDDFARSWRQTLRWLVADVPQRVDVQVEGDGREPFRIKVDVRDGKFEPDDTHRPVIEVTAEGKPPVTLRPQPSDEQPGQFVARYRPASDGNYRVRATVDLGDGELTAETGLVYNPLADELDRLGVDGDQLAELAGQTGGSVVALDSLASFAESLPRRELPSMTTRSRPFWHSWAYLTVVVGLLLGEWGLRRYRGLP